MLWNLGAISDHEDFGNKEEDASEGRGINWLKNSTGNETRQDGREELPDDWESTVVVLEVQD